MDVNKILTAVIDESRRLIVSPSEGYAGDSLAEVIEIDIGPFADEEFDFYIMNFEVFPTNGIIPSNIIRTESDEPAYISNGVIYCPLTSQLTESGTLRFQLEGHKKTEKGEVIKKSSIAELTLGDSLSGNGDKMIFGDSVYGRLEELENRVNEIDSENYGAEIGELEAQTAVLEGRAAALESRAADAESRLDTVESYNIPQSFSAFEERLSALEDEPDGLEALPVASADTLGGITVPSGSEFNVDENGRISLNYSYLNHFRLTAALVLTLLYSPGSVETIIVNSPEELSGYILDCTGQVASGMMSAFAFTSFSSGSVEYTDESFGTQTVQVEANAVYVFKIVDGVMQCSSYLGNELRNLILEGI